MVTTANPPKDSDTAEIPNVRLGSRLYLAVRYVRVQATVTWYAEHAADGVYCTSQDRQDRRAQSQDAKGKSGLLGRYGGEYGHWTMLGQVLEWRSCKVQLCLGRSKAE
jgi:hypothetical protein